MDKLKRAKRKISFLILITFLISSFLAFGENLYQYDSLELKLGVEGGFNLIGEGSEARVAEAKAELFLYPKESFRQKRLSWESKGAVEENKVVFEWKDPQLGKKDYGFEAKIRTENKRIGIEKKVPFPVAGAEEYKQYLEATETIDKDYPKITEKASELAEGEDDLFKVVFKLARWVEENVDYKLDTLTMGASQKASWVLEHREGVCDEMTSLFIAMNRALGIPARFVSGISYTTSELFKENWLPHGWAEVYFPGYGWVSFDIAFGEYGYVDVSHIQLREGFDPAEAATKFEWLANQVKLESEELRFKTGVERRGLLSKEEISLEAEAIGKEVDEESYNIIKGRAENKENYYAAVTLRLAMPKEIKLKDKEKKTILLGPKETKEVFWLVKVSEGLEEGYEYEFPTVVYSEKNISAEGGFKVRKGGVFYTEEEAKELMVEEEDKTYLKGMEIDCRYEKEIKIGETKEVKCTVKNKGNVNLKMMEFCLGGVCGEAGDLLINQEKELKIKVEGKEAGWQKLLVKAENPEISRKEILEYVVLDEPKIFLTTEGREEVGYGEDFGIKLELRKDSFSLPQNLVVVLGGKGFENKWEMAELKGEQKLELELNSRGMGKENEFKVNLEWEDKEGKKFKEEKIVKVRVKGKNWKEKLVIWWNGVAGWLK